MGTSDVLKILKIARAVGECNLRTFKTSRVTINHLRNARAGLYDFLFIVFSTKLLKRDTLFVLVFFQFWVEFSFSRPCLPDIQPSLCSFQRVFGFRIFFKLLNDVLV